MINIYVLATTGEGAEDFADAFHFPRQDVTTDSSYNEYLQWKDTGNCQPNFYTNIPEALYSCPPYPVAKVSTDGKGMGSKEVGIAPYIMFHTPYIMFHTPYTIYQTSYTILLSRRRNPSFKRTAIITTQSAS
ncbi:hypothetical protein EON63_01275 [archaeon]|nr:MAG: hypothetical protein EON63_01275 [archaeon]